MNPIFEVDFEYRMKPKKKPQVILFKKVVCGRLE
jgi:hypothetical protein